MRKPLRARINTKFVCTVFGISALLKSIKRVQIVKKYKNNAAGGRNILPPAYKICFFVLSKQKRAKKKIADRVSPTAVIILIMTKRSWGAKTKKRKVFAFRFFVVEVTGLEPTTSWSLTKRATKLRYTSIFTVLIFVRPFHDLLVPSSPHSALFSHRPAGQCSLSRSAAPLPKNLASLCSLRFPGALIDARYQTALSPRFCNYKIALGRSIGTAYTIIHFFP